MFASIVTKIEGAHYSTLSLKLYRQTWPPFQICGVGFLTKNN